MTTNDLREGICETGFFVEVNRVCDLCRCAWGTDGNKACDVGLTAKYAIPVIPPRCPRGYPMTRGYGNGKPIWKGRWKKAVMERIAKAERERRIILELTTKGRLTSMKTARRRARAGNRGFIGPISLKEVKKCRL